jgi:hypothetical protein
MKNIHILPTEKPSPLMIEDGKLFFSKNFDFNEFNETKNFRHINKQNIYITNLEEIKEGDWLISKEGNLHNNFGWNYGDRKIILTTDQDLIKDGVQAIDDDFLEWFLKNQSCESVEVVKEDWMITADLEFIYEIIIPKQETLEEAPKEKLDFYQQGFADGFKIQQEKSYSDEDMKQAFKVGFTIGYGSDVHAIDDKDRTFKKWFEQFKKK